MCSSENARPYLLLPALPVGQKGNRPSVHTAYMHTPSMKMSDELSERCQSAADSNNNVKLINDMNNNLNVKLNTSNDMNNNVKLNNNVNNLNSVNLNLKLNNDMNLNNNLKCSSALLQ
jgi:hypothetical protein